MIRRSLISLAVAAVSLPASAVPFMPMDARGLAMGNTGVASANRAHSAHYNPSLLAQADAEDTFSLLLPQIGFNLADEEELVDQANSINDNIVPRFEDLFDDSSSSNFTSAVEDLQASAEQLANTIESLDGFNPSTQAEAEAKAQELRDDAQNLSDSLDVVDSQVDEVNTVSRDLTDALDAISGDPLRARLGIGGALAFTGHSQIAGAISFNSSINLSGRSFFTENDQNLINAYGQAASGYIDAVQGVPDGVLTLADDVEAGTATEAQATQLQTTVDNVANYTSDPIEAAGGTFSILDGGQLSAAAEDPELDSYVQVVGIAVSELGVSLAHEFNIDGRRFAVGVTPKMQSIETFHFVSEMDSEEDIDEDDFEDSRSSYTHFNLDIGASFYVDDQRKWLVGVMAKDIIGQSFDLADAPIQGSRTNAVLEGGSLSLSPKIRAGVAYKARRFDVSADLDLTENDPVAFEKPTQYASVGAEWRPVRFFQLRGGLRTNLAGDNNVVSLGAGLSPWGVHMDLAIMSDISKPEKELGAALETGFYF
ncbi:MAG TPA: hypothetical protein DEA26_07995 [Oceanospirillales bacterium]|nr:hypothetical protein [Oceanospirillaceae bacterium]MAR01449.1 hypothetical protein [Oceanospirillaceae bacterium]HBS42607.1 hypothetical protein [Oceanospirillales bacterium]